MEANKLDGFLAFPADFTQKVMSGQNSSLEIISQAEATNTRMALNGLAQGIASSVESTKVEINSVVALMIQQGRAADIQKAITQIFQDRILAAIPHP